MNEELEQFLYDNRIESKEVYKGVGITSGSYFNAVSRSKKGTTPLWIRAFLLGVKMSKEGLIQKNIAFLEEQLKNFEHLDKKDIKEIEVEFEQVKSK